MCGGDSGYTCVAGTDCQDDKCLKGSPVGGPCGGRTNAYCTDDDAKCRDGKCVKESPLGGECGGDSGYTCVADTECEHNVCRKESAAGGPCGGSTNAFCPDGTRCESVAACVAATAGTRASAPRSRRWRAVRWLHADRVRQGQRVPVQCLPPLLLVGECRRRRCFCAARGSCHTPIAIILFPVGSLV
eukprot:TRINITY_DN986_c0_g1_i5.p1 TRINITY_DN986_c0_g1~~TRINITY_DN986_c0_g1_i5.p1  ORF type:complete len:197 (+),score=24.77 TRINITY_DN986_c0_g1_i5:31-591(+)